MKKTVKIKNVKIEHPSGCICDCHDPDYASEYKNIPCDNCKDEPVFESPSPTLSPSVSLSYNDDEEDNFEEEDFYRNIILYKVSSNVFFGLIAILTLILLPFLLPIYLIGSISKKIVKKFN